MHMLLQHPLRYREDSVISKIVTILHTKES